MHAFRHHRCIPGREQRPVAIIKHRTEFPTAILAQLLVDDYFPGKLGT
jgi:hypothetical protein